MHATVSGAGRCSMGLDWRGDSKNRWKEGKKRWKPRDGFIGGFAPAWSAARCSVRACVGRSKVPSAGDLLAGEVSDVSVLLGDAALKQYNTALLLIVG